MFFTAEQLLQLHANLNTGWIVFRNDEPACEATTEEEVLKAVDASGRGEGSAGAVDASGVWKIHVSIDPWQMSRAIPILHRLLADPLTPKMGLKIASNRLLQDGDHQSAKEVALIFDRVTEINKQGQQDILLFLYRLASQLEEAGIQPEATPPLTIETVEAVREHGSAGDKKNLERGKYDAVIRLREGERLSYFNYRDEMALVFDDDLYQDMVSSATHDERARMVSRSDFESRPQSKHNPLNRKDDFLNGMVLENHIRNTEANSNLPDVPRVIDKKVQLLAELTEQLNKVETTRAQILDIFAELKKQDGAYSELHRQKNPRFDAFRLFFKSRRNPDELEEKFWHTASYQQAVKLLKNAYVARDDQSVEGREAEANALVDYVRGNAVAHFKQTSTRKALK